MPELKNEKPIPTTPCPGCTLPKKLSGFDLLVLGMTCGRARDIVLDAMCPEHRTDYVPAMLRADLAMMQIGEEAHGIAEPHDTEIPPAPPTETELPQ